MDLKKKRGRPPKNPTLPTPKVAEVPVEEIEKKAKEDPSTKGWNNPNSRKNLLQHREDRPKPPDEIVFPDDDEDAELEKQITDIGKGRKLRQSMIRRLMPERGVFTAKEKERYVGIVKTFLDDFGDEELTASDFDDINEIAKSDILETRYLRASKNDTGVLVAVQQSLERVQKRKQVAKESLSARRADRKEAGANTDITIVDLVVRMDNEQKKKNKERLDNLLKEEKETAKRLKDVIVKDGY